MTKEDEQLLMQQLTDPKTQRTAFERLVREYSEQLYWQVRRMVLSHEDANDVMQNVFLKAWSHLDDFHHDAKISTWLYRIAVNESLDFLRRQKQEAIAQLPDVQRTVFNLHYFDDMKYSDISKLLNTSEGALKASYHIAVKKISEFFKQRD